MVLLFSMFLNTLIQPANRKKTNESVQLEKLENVKRKWNKAYHLEIK